LRRQRLIFGIATTDLILIFLVPFVAYWTARLALARGRSPWLWGGAALILGIPWPGVNLPILGVVPVLFLMFFVRPTARRDIEPRNACSKCASPHSPGQNYCTKCGWDLSREDSPEGADTELAAEWHQSQSAGAAALERPSESSVPETAGDFKPAAAEQEPSPPPDAAPEQADSLPGVAPDRFAPEAPEQEPEAVVQEARADEPVAPAPEEAVADASEPAEAPEPEPARPWGIPEPGPAPTAEVMTARGAVLLSEGKLQEAIDQFTKAIALDPRHREAFERRAEAYSRQGRQDRAEEDHQQAQALIAGS